MFHLDGKSEGPLIMVSPRETFNDHVDKYSFIDLADNITFINIMNETSVCEKKEISYFHYYSNCSNWENFSSSDED
jgi:hypothetical protein